jgi:small subunit ribosomal protein S11
MGFKGSKKNTPYAAGQAAADCGKVAYDLGLRKVEVFVKGPGSGRESLSVLCKLQVSRLLLSKISPRFRTTVVVLQNVEEFN